MRRAPSRSLHNLLHRPEALLYGKLSELLVTESRVPRSPDGIRGGRQLGARGLIENYVPGSSAEGP